MNQLLEQAIGLNNHGVSLLLSGQDDKSGIEALKQSLVTIKEMLRVVNSTVTPIVTAAAPTSIAYSSNGRFHGTVLLPNIWDEKPQVRAENVASWPREQQFMYQSAILLSLPPGNTNPEKDELRWQQVEASLHIYSSCILLNFAIALHRLAKRQQQCGAASPSLITKAEKLYEMAGTLLASGGGGGASNATSHQNHETEMLLKVVILNNLSLLLWESGHLDQARDGFQQLQDILRDIFCSWNEPATTTMYRTLFSPIEWDGLFRNVNTPKLTQPLFCAPSA